MREIKKVDLNNRVPYFGKTDPGVPGQEQKKEPEEKPEFAQNAPETLGRSLVNETDNLKNDVTFGMTHPQAIASADKFFDKAYENLKAKNHPHAYEEASAMTKLYVEEFCS